MFKSALADTPREAFNWRLVFSVICFGLMVSDIKSCIALQSTQLELSRALPEVSTKA